MTDSYPFMRISREFNVPYPVVICWAQALTEPSLERYWSMWAFKKVKATFPETVDRHAFTNAVWKAVLEFQRVQKEGW